MFSSSIFSRAWVGEWGTRQRLSQGRRRAAFGAVGVAWACELCPSATHLFRHSQVLDGVSPHITHRHAPKAVPVLPPGGAQACHSVREGGFRRCAAPEAQAGTSAACVLRALEVQITSRRCRFIHVSQLTRLPLYVSPFFSSTSCVCVRACVRQRGCGAGQPQAGQCDGCVHARWRCRQRLSAASEATGEAGGESGGAGAGAARREDNAPWRPRCVKRIEVTLSQSAASTRLAKETCVTAATSPLRPPLLKRLPCDDTGAWQELLVALCGDTLLRL